jgi:hypothetical protein
MSGNDDPLLEVAILAIQLTIRCAFNLVGIDANTVS